MFSTAAFKSLFFFSIFANLLMLVVPIHMLQIYDRVLTSGNSETLIYITIISIICLALYGLIETIRSIIAQRISANYAVSTADPLFNGLSAGRVPIEKTNQILREFNIVKSFLASKTAIGLFDLPFAPVFLALLFILHFQLGFITCLGAALLVGIAWLNKTATEDAHTNANRSNSEAFGFAGAMVQRAEDIRAMGIMSTLINRWGQLMSTSLNAQDAAAKVSAQYYGASKAVRQILQILILAWGAWLVLVGEISAGMIIAASMISQRALQPIEQVIGGWDQIVRAKSSYAEVKAILHSDSNSQNIRQPAPSGNLLINDLSYATELKDQKIPILSGINFSAKPGELIAIVGPSGAGKSTLARIIAGAISDQTGSVLLDGCAQKNWLPEQWGNSVGYLGQEVSFFPGTISENIARMEINPDENKIIEASVLSGAHDLINTLPNGYMTNLGSGQFHLSGGQKQRIALARAIYTKPRLLILDEPNAHLDQEGEAILSNALMNIKNQGVTVLVVTQRQRMVLIADKLLFIKNGQQVNFGWNQKNNSVTEKQNTKKSNAMQNQNPLSDNQIKTSQVA